MEENTRGVSLPKVIAVDAGKAALAAIREVLNARVVICS
jgi:excinuclease UvrABC nuclease subunit